LFSYDIYTACVHSCMIFDFKKIDKYLALNNEIYYKCTRKS